MALYPNLSIPWTYQGCLSLPPVYLQQGTQYEFFLKISHQVSWSRITDSDHQQWEKQGCWGMVVALCIQMLITVPRDLVAVQTSVLLSISHLAIVWKLFSITSDWLIKSWSANICIGQDKVGLLIPVRGSLSGIRERGNLPWGFAMNRWFWESHHGRTLMG